MSEQNKNTEMPLAMKGVFNELQASGDFEIKPCKVTNIEDNPKYKKLDLTRNQKMRMSGFAGQLPMIFNAASGAAMANALSDSTYYVMSVPNGIPYTLSNLKDGFDNSLRGADGKYALKLPLYQVDISEAVKLQAVVMSTFTAMSIATGQYFLSEINGKLNVMKMNIDKVLEFLYDDKKAELIANVNFTRYAYQNYNAIMPNNVQKIATISTLQEARKIAVKDCEFYSNDLSHTVNKKNEVEANIKNAFKLKEVLDLSMNLYLTSNLLEVYYAQNFDSDYLAYVEKDVMAYIDKCEKMMIEIFGTLKTNINNGNGEHMFYKIPDKEKHIKHVDEILESLHDSGDSEMRKMLSRSLRMPIQKKDYYISPNGEVYVKIS